MDKNKLIAVVVVVVIVVVAAAAAMFMMKGDEPKEDPAIHVTGISLDKTSAEIAVGESISLKYTIAPADATNKAVTWNSSNPEIATVLNGNVKAVSEGSVAISVVTADGNFTAICVVKVTPGEAPVRPVKEYDSVDDGLLTVFGNANGDSVINSDDLAIINKVIELTEAKDEAKLNEYLETLPVVNATTLYKGELKAMYLADANCDGKINNLDRAIVEKVIKIQSDLYYATDGKDVTSSLTPDELYSAGVGSVDIFYLDVDSVMARFSYPLTGNMAIGYKSNYESALILGANSRCAYACNQVADPTSSYYAWYHPYFSEAKNIGSRFTPDYEIFVKNGAPQMFVSGTRAWFDANMETTLTPLGVSVIRLPFWEDNVCNSSVVTFGFLIGCPNAALEYAQKVTAVLDTIEEAVKDIPVEERPFVFQSYNGGSISTMHNGIHEAVLFAGGSSPYQHGYTNGNVDPEAVRNMNADFIGLDQYYGFLETWDVKNPQESFDKMIAQLKDTDLKYMQAINMTDAYANGNVFGFNQGTYMGPASYLTIAYMYNFIYGVDTFDVDAMFADYLACYHPEFKVSDFVVNGMNVQFYCLEDYLKATQ